MGFDGAALYGRLSFSPFNKAYRLQIKQSSSSVLELAFPGGVPPLCRVSPAYGLGLSSNGAILLAAGLRWIRSVKQDRRFQ